jgi:hypothetical protein
MSLQTDKTNVQEVRLKTDKIMQETDITAISYQIRDGCECQNSVITLITYVAVISSREKEPQCNHLNCRQRDGLM